MMSRLFFITVLPFLLISGCKEPTGNKLMTELASCDSAAIMYYYEPGKPRFFNMGKLYDKESIAALSENVNGELITSKGNCVTEGKIYAYGKGDAVYVVYFSRAADCMTLSFIKTGEKYFVKMNGAIKKLLDDEQKKAKEPRSEN